eukprot:6471369-Amphidinium_carterae.1
MLSAVDSASGFHQACLLKSRESKYVARKFTSLWIAHYGAPQEIAMDQGGEFAGEFIQAMEEMAMPTRIAGSHSPWQVGIGERHGQVLGFMLSAVIYDQHISAWGQLKVAVSSCVQAKNSQMKRSGFSPEQMVFGRSLEWLNDLCSMEAEKPRLPVLTQQQEHWRAAVLRHRAAQAFHRLAISDKMRRAMLRSSPPAKEYLVGESVYFWTPGARRGSRLVPDAGRWRGPASILSKEGER